MDNAQKAIMIGVGLFVTILIIAAVMLIVTPAINLINNASKRLGNLEATLVNQLTQTYDDTTVTGTQVIAAVSQYCTDEDMIIEVQAVKDGTILEYGKIRGNGTVTVTQGLSYDSSHPQTKVSALTDSSNKDSFVQTNARFDAHLIKNGDAVVGLLFQRK